MSSGLLRSGRKIRFVAHDYDARDDYTFVASWVGEADLAATREDVTISVDGHPTTLPCLHAKSVGALMGGEFEFWVVDDDAAPLMLGLHGSRRSARGERRDWVPRDRTRMTPR